MIIEENLKFLFCGIFEKNCIHKVKTVKYGLQDILVGESSLYINMQILYKKQHNWLIYCEVNLHRIVFIYLFCILSWGN